MQQSLFVLAMIVFGSVALWTIWASVITVEHKTIAVVQRLGKFLREAGPGLHFKAPFFDRVVGRVNMRIRQLDVEVYAKSEDGAFVQIVVAVQYCVLDDRVYDAFYSFDDALQQIVPLMRDVVRERTAKMSLEALFGRSDEIATALRSELVRRMEACGHRVLGISIKDVIPDAKVKIAMNEISAAQRMRAAFTERSETQQQLGHKAAAAESQNKALLARGLAEQRRTVIAALRDSVEGFMKTVPGATAKDVMNLVLMANYFDMLKTMRTSSSARGLLAPQSPGSLGDLSERMLNALVEVQQPHSTDDNPSERSHQIGAALAESQKPQGLAQGGALRHGGSGDRGLPGKPPR